MNINKQKGWIFPVFAIFLLFSCSNGLLNNQLEIETSLATRSTPVLSSTSILDGATDVEVGLPMEVTFTTNVALSQLSGNVSLTNSLGDAVRIRLEVDGNKLIIFSQKKLQPTKSYTYNILGTDITITYTDLDFGLYWFGIEGRSEKYFPGYSNEYYDANNKSMIFSHGWESGSIEKQDNSGRDNFFYEEFLWDNDDANVNTWTNTGWINKGWNTGLVFWNQFSDDDNLWNAEEKIWSLTNGQNTYKTVSNGNVVTKTWDRKYSFDGVSYTVDSVGELLSIPVISALSNNTSGNIRIAGHSLGNQVASYLTKSLTENGIDVDRLALLDPAWTASSKSYLPNDSYGNWTGSRVRNFISEMLDDGDLSALEIYHSTALNYGLGVTDNNQDLLDIAADVDLAPWYFSSTQIGEKHVAAWHNYMWSMSFSAPVECYISWWRRYKTGEEGPSASTSTSRIVDMMNSNNRWTQVEGRYTATPSDDWFEKK